MPKIAKGDVLPLIKLPTSPEQSATTFTPAKRAWYVQEIAEAFAVGLLRDVQAFARGRTVPRADTTKRRLWEGNRAQMLDSFMRLFQLEQDSNGQRDTWTRGSVVIDVPSNPALPAPDPIKPPTSGQ